jgi:hypothetical protein
MHYAQATDDLPAMLKAITLSTDKIRLLFTKCIENNILGAFCNTLPSSLLDVYVVDGI